MYAKYLDTFWLPKINAISVMIYTCECRARATTFINPQPLVNLLVKVIKTLALRDHNRLDICSQMERLSFICNSS